MLLQKASVFGRGARAVFPGEDIPAFWREASFGNAFDGSDPPGRWDPPFANLPPSDATFFPSLGVELAFAPKRAPNAAAARLRVPEISATLLLLTFLGCGRGTWRRNRFISRTDL